MTAWRGGRRPFARLRAGGREQLQARRDGAPATTRRREGAAAATRGRPVLPGDYAVKVSAGGAGVDRPGDGHASIPACRPSAADLDAQLQASFAAHGAPGAA